ncbi:Regulator of chromosome condensation, RCC1 [Dillenia turbinata]|uniref:Regulator of chromosome condensation, RCC1 n=1 Tax=Dillenia turbinata TaxID=194707 RepID=A0AAN8UM06_9MAGN
MFDDDDSMMAINDSDTPTAAHPSSDLPKSLLRSCEEDDQNVTVQLLSLGRGASGQLGGGTEEIRDFPNPGKGDGARLGFGHENSVFEPSLNPNFDCGLKSVALGVVHSIALTSAGQVFTWGYGDFGALGHSVYHRELSPRLVEGPWDGRISHVATSGTHTAAITESDHHYPPLPSSTVDSIRGLVVESPNMLTMLFCL